MQRFALLGAGFIGTVHAENLAAHPDIELVSVYDVDAARATTIADRFGATAASDLTAVFDPDRIDAVFIASSTDTHAEHLRRAADVGLAALCEKPIDLDLTRAIEVVEYAEARGARVMVDFNRRFDRDHAALRRIVDDGAVGAVELVQLTSRGPSMPPLAYIAVSGGQMRDQAVHFFDLARWITGEDPTSVYAAGSALAEPAVAELDDVDTSVVTLTMPSGALVQIDCTRRTGYGYDERIEVAGSTGLVESRRQRDGNVTRYGDGTITDDGLHAGWFERVRPTYRAALDAFVVALETGGPMPTTLRDGLAAQAVAEAATRSLTTHRAEPVPEWRSGSVTR